MSEVLTIPTPKEFIKTKEAADRAREAEEHQRLREQEAAERQRLREEAAAPTPDRRELVRTFESAPRTVGEATLAAVRRWNAHVEASDAEPVRHLWNESDDDDDKAVTTEDLYGAFLDGDIQSGLNAKRAAAMFVGSGTNHDPEDDIWDNLRGDYNQTEGYIIRSW